MTKTNRMLFAALLVLVMVFAAACSGKDAGKGGKETAPTAAAGNDTQSTEPGITEPAVEELQPVLDVVGTVLYDQDGVKITVTDYNPDLSYGPKFYVSIANNTDRVVRVSTELLSVNGYMMNDGVNLYKDLAAGTEEEDYILLSNEFMGRCGIKQLSNMAFYVYVLDPETNVPLSEPQLVTLDVTARCNQTVDTTGQELYNKDGIRIIFKGVDSDELYEGAVYFLIENNSGENISVYTNTIALNGVSVDNIFWTDVRDGAVALECFYLEYLSDYELESLAQIETVTVKFQLINFETMDGIDTCDYVTINVE